MDVFKEVPFDWERLAAEARYSARRLAEISKLPPWKLRRECQRLFGRSPRSLLGEWRLKAATSLLASAELVKQAAADAGYRHPSNFCRWFKGHCHSTPSQFRSAPPDGGEHGTGFDGADI